MAGKMRIVQPGDRDFVQTAFAFGIPEYSPTFHQKFPVVYRDLEGFKKVLYDTSIADCPSVGYDLEFNAERPTIIGIASLTEAASLPWDAQLAKEVVDVVSRRGGALVAYSAFGADKPVTDKAIGKETPLDCWEDAMEMYYLLHQALAKSGDRSEEEEDMGSLGFFGLWSMASFYTDLSQWKVCKGVDCPAAQGEKYPCPRHDVWAYNGVDAYAGLVGFYNMRKEMSRRGIPYSLYKERLKLSFICNAMEERGIAHDAEYIAKLEERAAEYKAKLFPHTTDAKGNITYTSFNPNAPEQIVKHFHSKGIALKDATKKTIHDTLEERLKKLGILCSIKELDTYPDELDPLTKELYETFEYKQTGKGCSAWFDQKYFRDDGLIHPRFVTTGAQTTRLSSSKPNFTNVPARGWGALVRGGIVPRDKKTQRWVKSDFSQLELRSCLTAGNRVLKTDLTWSPVEDIKVGDQLIGFDEQLINGWYGSRYKPSEVEAVGTLEKSCYRVVTTEGTFEGSDDHMMVVMRPRKGVLARTWVRLDEMVVDDKLPFTVEPWEPADTYEAGYLAGIYDGEGWLSETGVGFAQAEGPIFDQVEALVIDYGFVTGKWFQPMGYIAKHNKRTTKNHWKTIITGMWNNMRFLGMIRPQRLLRKNEKLWLGKRSWGKNQTKHASILSIEKTGTKTVYAIQTSTRTYMAEGFMSHNCLWQAGMDVSTIKGDAFVWLVENSNGMLAKAAEIMQDTERQAAKSVSHGADYLEGFTLKTYKELESVRTLQEIRAGALIVFHPKFGRELWEWRGQVVCFTGANLSERLFGNKEYANRRKANEIQEGYFLGFPQVRKWQMESLAAIENSNYVRYPSGHQLEVIGPDVDVAKAAIAGLGQGIGAVAVLGVVVKNWEDTGDLPELIVHDEVNFTRPRDWSDEKILDSYRFMSAGRPDILPGFTAPAGVYRGETWLPEENSKNPYPPELRAICLEKIGKV